MDKTTVFDFKDLRQELIYMDLKEVVDDLNEKGYNATNQLVGYITSGDVSYITNYNNSRAKIQRYSKNEILVAIVNDFVGK